LKKPINKDLLIYLKTTNCRFFLIHATILHKRGEKMKKLMVSGYKSAELGIFNPKDPKVTYIKKAIEQRLRRFIEEGLEMVVISGQLGVELWTAEVVIELKKEFPQVKCAVITPFLDQEKKWKESTQEYYYSIINQVDIVTTTSDYPYVSPKQFQNRDQAVMQKTDGLFLVYDEEKEGSPKYLKAKALKYGENHPFSFYEMDFYEIQEVVQEIIEEEQENNA